MLESTVEAVRESSPCPWCGRECRRVTIGGLVNKKREREITRRRALGCRVLLVDETSHREGAQILVFLVGMMMIAGVLIPTWFISFPTRLPPGNWIAYLVWLDYLAVVLMMFRTVWAALEPVTGPLPKRRTRAPAPGFHKDPRVF